MESFQSFWAELGGKLTPRAAEARVDPHAALSDWLHDFENALTQRDPKALAPLLHPDCHWRDLLAFTWDFKEFVGHDAALAALVDHATDAAAHGFRVPPDRARPRWVRRLGVELIEGIFSFETRIGRCAAVARLVPDQGRFKAWVLATNLIELIGFEERIGSRRPTGEAYSRNFGTHNWLDDRLKSQAYRDRDPTVLVVGAGQAGLTIAARLRLLGVDTLAVDKHTRVGDNWRKRYHSLALHNQIEINHLAYLPFPESWPTYIPKDMLGNWFEFYADAMEVNVWTGTEFVGGDYDEENGHWNVTVRRADDGERTMSPRHLIFANGVSGLPRVPRIEGLDSFGGEVLHSHDYTDGSKWAGKRALVIGSGNSGHDIAQDLYSHGVQVTLVQRGPTTVASIDPSAKLNFAIYYEGLSLEDCDLLASASCYPHVVRGYQLAVERMVEYDKELIAGLQARGFQLDYGEDNTGHQMKNRRRGGGFYLDAGCSGLIISGAVGLLQAAKIDRYGAGGALLEDGSLVPADVIVLATGYHTQQELVRRLLGEAIAERIGPVWGMGEDGQLNNMWRRTNQPGLWFMGGGFQHCRIYSRHLALQIKAVEEGLLNWRHSSAVQKR